MKNKMIIAGVAAAIAQAVPAFATLKVAEVGQVVSDSQSSGPHTRFAFLAVIFIVALGCVALAWWVGPGGEAWRRRWWGV